MRNVVFRSYYLKRKVHISWLIAACSIGIFCGIVLARTLPIGMFGSVSWLAVGLLLSAISFWRARVWFLSVVILAGIFIGLWRGSSQLDDYSNYQQLYGSTIAIEGKISEDIEKNKRDQLVLRLDRVSINDTNLDGKIWITTTNNSQIQRSDIVKLKGKLYEGFGTFQGAMYEAELVEVQRMAPGDVALGVRQWFANGVATATNEPQTSLGLGYLVGQRRGLPEELDSALKIAGLTHIVVASGYNLTILVRLARRLFEKISKYLAFIAASGMILSFIAITGMSPSMSRAGLVAGLSLLAWYYGRRFHPLVLLPLAIAITVLVNPSYAWGDVGWQLSFAAFAGVMILAPLMNAYFFGDRPERPIGRILIETASAQLYTLPIILVTFGQFSVIAPIANLLILPFVPITMLLTFIAGIGGILLPPLASVIGMPAEAILSYMTQTILFVGEIPWALQDITLGIFGGVILYSILISGTIYLWWKTRLDLAKTSLVE